MNLLAGAKRSSRLILSSPSSTKHPFYLHPISISDLHHCNFYSTKATSTSIDKTQQLPKPRIHKSTVIKSPSLWQGNHYRKPLAIPYQEKLANLVNFIGNVKDSSVQYECEFDGKRDVPKMVSVTSVISVGSLLIPVVFEGELARLVSWNVKINDRIFVSGQMNRGPLRQVMCEGIGDFHIVGENINFVLDKNSSVEVDHDHDQLSGVKGDSSTPIESNAVPLYHDDDHDHLSGLKGNSSTPIESNAVPLYEAETVPLPPHSVAVESGRNSNVSVSSFADQTLDLWTDLVKNPQQWWDYRGHKTNGLVKEKFPDFKHKETGQPLWITSAPKWVFPALEMLEFDVKEIKSDKQNAKNLEDSWKDLVENPAKWWDNRARKKNSKAPDFRHKETGEALWLNSSPAWALSKLPPVNTA